MNNNCDYQRAYNYVQNYNKNRIASSCCCSPRAGIGPTGPTGPQGPATITIGETTTGLPGTEASVTNTGTDQNVILNFAIPAGPTGPQGIPGIPGETGPTGEQGIEGPTGPTGATPTFTAEATSVPFDTGASATLTPTGENAYTLNLSIPYGPTGPSAPGLAAYGGGYSTGQQTVTTNDTSTPGVIPLQTAMPESNTTFATNQVTINENGAYQITYSVTLSPTTGGNISVYVRQGQTKIDESEITNNVTGSNTQTYSNSFIDELTSEDVIDLVLVTSTTNDTVNVTNATLTVKKLDGVTPADRVERSN